MGRLNRTRVIFLMCGLILSSIVVFVANNTAINGKTRKTELCLSGTEVTKKFKHKFITDRLAASEAKHQETIKDRKFDLASISIQDSSPFKVYPGERMFWDFFYPSFDCPYMTERIGRRGDGGKWVCGFNQLKVKPCIVYSFGVAGDFSFEEEILSRSTNCTVRMFDPTVSLQGPLASFVNKFSPRVTFEKLGLGKANHQQIRTLGSLMRVNGHDFIDILKIDIEGPEFEALAQIVEEFHQQLPVGQLQVEIHMSSFKGTEKTEKEDNQKLDSPGKTFLKQFVSWWEQLEGAGLRAFHREVNQLPILYSNENHVSCFEFSFVNIWNQRNVILTADY